MFYQSEFCLALPLVLVLKNHCRVSSLFTLKSKSTTQVAKTRAKQADINIFTVASGLLYEVSSLSLSTMLTASNNSPLPAIRFYHDS
jgi:hypothetical protein